MEILMILGVSLTTGLLSIFALYFACSRKVDKFYEETNDSGDASGIFLIVGWVLMGIHKLLKLILPKYHSLVLRITTFIFGVIFLAISIGIWFVDLTVA